MRFSGPLRLTFVLSFLVFLVGAECYLIVSTRSAMARGESNETMGHAIATHAVFTGSAANDQDVPVLVEMFLSQSCSSCVPAAAYVNDLAKRKNVVVLSWHVDYWDNLVVAGHGRWKDPYSSRAYTNRQRDYKINKSARGRIYTPQAVVAGQYEAVGSRKLQVNTQIQSVDAQTNALNLQQNGNTLTAEVKDVPGNYEAYLISFHKSTATSILGGENAGHDWTESNVVSSMRKLNAGRTMAIDLKAREYGDGIGCAVILQEPELGKVLAASYCPE